MVTGQGPIREGRDALQRLGAYPSLVMTTHYESQAAWVGGLHLETPSDNRTEVDSLITSIIFFYSSIFFIPHRASISYLPIYPGHDWDTHGNGSLWSAASKPIGADIRLQQAPDLLVNFIRQEPRTDNLDLKIS